MYKKYIKRLIGIIGSFLGIALFIVPMLLISLCIMIDSKGPVFFIQKRVGKNKEYFNILKFRTMRIDAPKNVPTHLLENPEVCITKVGSFLRKTSLDELPQLFNILFGQMAFVGPRPALWNQYDLIEERDKYQANSVTPGLTGLAQINGRDELSIEQKSSYDGEYVKNISFSTDAIIFFKTITAVFQKRGVIEGKQTS